MGRLLTFVETQDGRLKRSSLEVLSRCRAIADRSGDEVSAAIAASDPSAYIDRLARHGASSIYTVSDPVFTQPPTIPQEAPLLTALTRIAEEANPAVLALPSSESVKQILGALAVRLGAPALADVSSFELHDEAVEARRPVLASKFVADVRAEGNPVIVSVRSGSYAAVASPVDPVVHEVDFTFDSKTLRAELVDLLEAGGGAADLSEARVVVAAGRGVRDEQGKALIEELAGVLGAAIGSSRAVVESGLFPASSQVGQTGKVVSPDLYVAVGISGAIQHVAGMTNSRVIVAINKDRDAPIFRYATYGIVGDLYDVLPKLITALKSS